MAKAKSGTEYKNSRIKLGELRPSQLMHSFGVGALIDLPNLSVVIRGISDWNEYRCLPLEKQEERLLRKVQESFPTVENFLLPPVPDEKAGGKYNPKDPGQYIGVPVSVFPRWYRCTACNRLTPLQSGITELKGRDTLRTDKLRYVHVNCEKSKSALMVPVRRLTICPDGHMDEFPWREFVHDKHRWGDLECTGPLFYEERGVSGTAQDIVIKCGKCEKEKRLIQALGEEGSMRLPQCRGRHPHVPRLKPGGCDQNLRTVILGAANNWFPLTLSCISLPTKSAGEMEQLLEPFLRNLKNVESVDDIKSLRKLNVFEPKPAILDYTDEQIYGAVLEKRQAKGKAEDKGDLRIAEWRIFSREVTVPEESETELKIKDASVPEKYSGYIDRVTLVERMREVMCLTGFTRLESPGEFGEYEQNEQVTRAPITFSGEPTWLPAGEQKGEGIFLQFNEKKLRQWESRPEVMELHGRYRKAHMAWRESRGKRDLERYLPDMRYILLHSFSHALIRRFSLECGYSSSSLRERIYSTIEDDGRVIPMAGILIYTASSDSEGTLGGLVRLGRTELLERHLEYMLNDIQLCSSDPLCAEEEPDSSRQRLNGAACHSCLYLSETSCERGNKYLDRSLLGETLGGNKYAFFRG